jgi:uncharacterized phage protein gp47/JayE
VRETVETVRARLDVDANAGVAPTDQGYIDTTEGGAYYDLTQPAALEAERLWDFLATEVVAAMFVQSAWGDYLDMHGEMLGVPRKPASLATGEVTFTGLDGTFIATGTEVAQPATDPDADPVTLATTAPGIIGQSVPGEVTLPVEAEEPGPASNLPAHQITFLVTPIDDVASVDNAANTSGGADVEEDESYQARLLLEWRSPGAAGNISDYEKWALAYPGVGDVTVTAVWNGAWTVRIVVTDPDGNPVSGTVTDGLKNLLDPLDGTGDGLAPVGANVTVATVTSFVVPVSAQVRFETGYSLDGTGGTIALRSAIQEAIIDYVDALHPGEDVIRAKVESLFFRIAGIKDVTSVTLNGLAANFDIADTQVATTNSQSISLTAF